MTVLRRFPMLTVWAGLLVQPACMVTHTRPMPAPAAGPAPVVVQSAPTTATTQFAELIRAPGDRVAVNDPNPVVETRHEAPAPPPAVEPVQPKELPQLPVPPAPAPPPDPPLVAAVRAFVDNRPDEAATHLKALDPPNQELMLQLIPAVVRASRVPPDKGSPTEMGVLAGQFQTAADTFAARAPLGLDRACFCRGVKNFGRYEPVPDGTPFRPGAVAELYVEVRNAPSVPADDGYVTQLACTLQVRDAAGAVVELADRSRRPVPALTESKRDVTRSPVRDYFLLFRFPVPTRPGAYSVSVEVRDPATGRFVSRTIPLRVQ